MKNQTEMLENLPERILKPIHINRTVCMAVDFLSDMASTESVEAIQTTLRIQEGILEKISNDITEIKMPVDLQEKALEALHLNRTVCMAVDFLPNNAASESVESVQNTLQIQEEKLKELYDDIGKILFPDKS